MLLKSIDSFLFIRTGIHCPLTMTGLLLFFTMRIHGLYYRLLQYASRFPGEALEPLCCDLRRKREKNPGFVVFRQCLS